MLFNDAVTNRQLQALDRQFDKYGHDALIRQDSTDIPTKVLGASFKTLYQSGTTIVNPNYRLFIRVVSGIDDITLTTKIVINDTVLNIVAFKKITPDVANAIVWEIEATGGVVPQDPSTLSDPEILFPLANAEYVLSSSDDAIASITFLAATPETTGGAVWTGVEWEAREEVSETVVATAVVSGSASWTAPSIFSKVVNYQVRCRYIGVAADASPIVTDYTAYNTFSRVNLIDPAPPVYITKPSIISLVNEDGEYEVWQSYSDDRLGPVIGKYPYPASGFARAFLAVDAYDPIDAGARLSVDWQVSLSSDFSSFVINGTQTGSWFDDIEAIVYPITQMYTGQQDAFPIARNVLHYARVRYNSVDSKTSEWSDTFVYKIVAVEGTSS